MIKSMETMDQDDFFDFLREDEHLVGHDWLMAKPAAIKTDISVDPLLDSFSQNTLESNKKTDTFS